jgi:hypothetical protein
LKESERPQLVATLLGVLQNNGLVTANLGTWDGETELHEGDIVFVTDAGAGPYEALVESISGSWATLRVTAFAAPSL